MYRISVRFILNIALLAMFFVLDANAQYSGYGKNSNSNRDTNTNSGFASSSTDSISKSPRGLKVWKVDDRFGTIIPSVPDTLHHLFQNDNLTSGRTGMYNHTGNLGSPRMSRIYNGNQDFMMGNQFVFLHPFDMALNSVNDCLFTNTKSPITNLSWMSQGNKLNGDDRLRVNFATNINKDAGIGFKVDYLFGRGYYNQQQQSSVAAKVFGSYRGEKYQVHSAYVTDKTKNAENGGLADETYITHPEYQSTKYKPADMPIRLNKAFNRLKVNSFFLTHRYNIGYVNFIDSMGNKLSSKAYFELLTPKDSIHQNTVTDSTLLAINADSLNNTLDTVGKSKDENEIAINNEKNSDLLLSDFKRVFVPVAALIHTFKFDHDNRRYIDNGNQAGFYIHDFFPDVDKINDRSQYLSLDNTLGLEMQEGFKKWVKTGMRLFGKHQLTRFGIPELDGQIKSTTINYVTLGAQMMREKGNFFHYNLLGELRTTGIDWGEFNVEGNIKFTFPVRQNSIALIVDGYVRNEEPSYFYRHYHSSSAWWDNDLNKIFRSRVQGTFLWKKTKLKVSFETIQNHTFFQEHQDWSEFSSFNPGDFSKVRYGVSVSQSSQNIQLLQIGLCQDLKFGPLVWENELTYQQSSDLQALPLPFFNGWSNLYFHFDVAKVLRTDIGADLVYFTKYAAPAYSPMLGVYAVQDQSHIQKTGNYPWVNIYANFHLKNCRFYLMVSHINCSSGHYFLTPHYPTNQRTFRFGISWNFFN